MISIDEFHKYCEENNLRHNLNDSIYVNFLNTDFQYLFVAVCDLGYLETAQWLYAFKHEIEIFEIFEIYILNDAFEMACEHNHLDVVQWLYSTGKIRINKNEDEIFLWICRKGYFEMIKWFCSVGVNFHSHENEIFFLICNHKYIDIIQWFLFDLDFRFNEQLINEYPICKLIIERAKQKRGFFNGYIYGGGDDDKPLSKVSHNCFLNTLLMI